MSIQSLVGAVAQGHLGNAQIDVALARAIARHGLAWDVDCLAEPSVYMSQNAEGIIKRASRQALLRSMAVAGQASWVAQILDAAGLRALVYKGSPLAVQTTGTWRGRGSADVDVLVAPSDLPSVHRSLLHAGMDRSDGEDAPPGRFTRYMECERSYTGMPVTVDLHWRIDSTPGYFRVDFDELWARRVPIDVPGLRAWAPGCADALVITAVHGTREQWVRARWRLDAARQLMTVSPTEWRTATAIARRGARRALAVTLGVARLCDAPGLPAEPGVWATRIARMMLDQAGGATTSQTSAGASAALVSRMDRWRTADSAWTAWDGAIRALARQVVGDSEKSIVRGRRTWSIGARP